MGQREILLAIAGLLNIQKIPYLLTGSFASSFYGYPRATHDIDFIVEVNPATLKKLASFLPKLGSAYVFSKQEFGNIDAPRMVNVYHRKTGTKIDFWITETDKFKHEFSRRNETRYDHVKLTIVSAEDLILTKLLWSKEIRSERHLRDCAGIWSVQKGKLDKRYLRSRARELSVTNLLDEISTQDIENEGV